MNQNVSVGDRVQMKKPHPCGSDEWMVYRIGADIGIRCTGCDRRVLLVRSEFFKRLKKIVTSATTMEGSEH
jgi:hypothetical protein